MDRLRHTTIKNAAFNVLRGCAMALAAIVLPHYLTHSLSAPRFAAWSLLLQIAAYASFLDFGLQTAVARFVAQAMELRQAERGEDIVETAFVMLSLAGIFAFAIIAVITACAHSFFVGVPPQMLREFQMATLLISAGTALNLALSAFSGVLVGLHRNELPAAAQGTARALGVILAVLAVQRTQSLVVLAACVAGTALCGGIAQWLMARRLMPSLRTMRFRLHHGLVRELSHYCTGLTVWSLGMLLVSGLDVTIVAHYQFSAAGYYAVAASVIALMAGLNSTVLSAFLTPQAVLHARGQRHRLSDVLRRTTRGSSLVNLYIALMFLILGLPLLRLWVGDVYAQRALPVLIILAFAQFIRLAGAPYCMMLISTGQQNKGILNGVVEALVNLAASLWLASRIGYVGVAWGTMIGAVAGLVVLITYTVPRTQLVRFGRIKLIDSGLVRPFVCLLPLLFYALAVRDNLVPIGPVWLLTSISACLGLVWLFR